MSKSKPIDTPSIEADIKSEELDPKQAELLEILNEADRPFLSMSDIKNRLENQETTKNTIRTHLRKLHAKGLIYERPLNPEEEKPVKYYYSNDDHTDWPMPPDVTPEAAKKEMTVEEFFNKQEVRTGITGIAIGFVGAGLTYAFATLAATLGTGGIVGTMYYGGVIVGFIATIVAYIYVARALLQIFTNGNTDILPYW